MGLGNFIRRGPLVVINEVGGTSRSGNTGAVDFRKQDTVTRKGSRFPGPIFSPGFLFLRHARGSYQVEGPQAAAEQPFCWKWPETRSLIQSSCNPQVSALRGERLPSAQRTKQEVVFQDLAYICREPLLSAKSQWLLQTSYTGAIKAGHVGINVKRGLPPLRCCKRPCIDLPTPVYMINVHDKHTRYVHMHVYMLTLGNEQKERRIKNHMLYLCSSSISSYSGLQPNFFTSDYFKTK